MWFQSFDVRDASFDPSHKPKGRVEEATARLSCSYTLTIRYDNNNESTP